MNQPNNKLEKINPDKSVQLNMFELLDPSHKDYSNSIELDINYKNIVNNDKINSKYFSNLININDIIQPTGDIHNDMKILLIKKIKQK